MIVKYKLENIRQSGVRKRINEYYTHEVEFISNIFKFIESFFRGEAPQLDFLCIYFDGVDNLVRVVLRQGSYTLLRAISHDCWHSADNELKRLLLEEIKKQFYKKGGDATQKKSNHIGRQKK